MYRTSDTIDTYLNILPLAHPDLCSTFSLPEPTVEGRTVRGIRLRAGRRTKRRGALLVGGTHARELMNPDLLVELAVELATAYRTGTGITLGNREWSEMWVQLILESLDIFIVPNINPDGREYVQRTDRMWRKNRRDNPGTGCDGVDINRNTSFVWGSSTGSSCSPCADTYCGPKAFSEPEGRNVRWLLREHRIDVFADIHSYSNVVLYPWGHAKTQTTNPKERFTNLQVTPCQPLPADRREYMAPSDRRLYRTVATRVVEAIADVHGTTYRSMPIADLYANDRVCGDLADYAYSRHISSRSAPKTYGWSLETGPYTGSSLQSFQPDDPEPVKREGKSGILMLLAQWVCGIDLIAAGVIGDESAGQGMREFRDTVLLTTEAGQAWAGLFERNQAAVVGLVADGGAAEQLGGLLVAADDLIAGRTRHVSGDDVDRARSLLASMRERADDSLARDLSAVDALLDRCVDADLETITALLRTRAPEGLNQ